MASLRHYQFAFLSTCNVYCINSTDDFGQKLNEFSTGPYSHVKELRLVGIEFDIEKTQALLNTLKNDTHLIRLVLSACAFHSNTLPLFNRHYFPANKPYAIEFYTNAAKIGLAFSLQLQQQAYCIQDVNPAHFNQLVYLSQLYNAEYERINSIAHMEKHYNFQRICDLAQEHKSDEAIKLCDASINAFYTIPEHFRDESFYQKLLQLHLKMIEIACKTAMLELALSHVEQFNAAYSNLSVKTNHDLALFNRVSTYDWWLKQEMHAPARNNLTSYQRTITRPCKSPQNVIIRDQITNTL